MKYIATIVHSSYYSGSVNQKQQSALPPAKIIVGKWVFRREKTTFRNNQVHTAHTKLEIYAHCDIQQAYGIG